MRAAQKPTPPKPCTLRDSKDKAYRRADEGCSTLDAYRACTFSMQLWYCTNLYKSSAVIPLNKSAQCYVLLLEF